MIARRVLRLIFERVGKAASGISLRVEFADGSSYENCPGKGQPDIVVRFRTASAEWHSCVFFYEGLFESYIDEQVDIEGRRPIATLAQVGWQLGLDTSFLLGLRRNPLSVIRQWIQERRQDNSDRGRSIRNADFHYAVHPALFEHMLGGTVGYSEGLWFDDTRTINQAKYNNYDYVCRKLRLRPGLKVLEVGAGWGYMAIHMAKRYGVDVTIYNPVRRQNDYMRARFERHGLGGAIRLVEGDHRDILGEGESFDRFVSVGVHEHAGYPLRQYRLWARAIAGALKPGGLGLVSTTSLMDRVMTEMLTLKYIFPGGHVPSLPDTLQAFHHSGLMLVEVENLWPHYQRTLANWCDAFARHWPEIQRADPETFTEQFRRRWTMWLEGTMEVFGNSLDLSHIVFAKGRNAEYFPWPPGESHGFAAIGGDQEPEYYQ